MCRGILRQPRFSSARRAIGFTLIEILCVVIIMGIAGAIVVPQMSQRDDMKVAAASRMLMSDLIYAQNAAITNQSPCYLKFDVAGKKYSVCNSAMSVMTHPVNGGNYTASFGSGGTNGLTSCSIVSASFVGTADTNTYAIIGFDEQGAPQAYNGNNDPLTTGTVVLQVGQSKMQVGIEPFTGSITSKYLP